MGKEPTIVIGGTAFRRFIHPPGPVEDGTVRCIRCGQIDEPELHEPELCVPSPAAQAFILANRESPIIAARTIEPDPTKPARGLVYTLADKRRFRLTPANLAFVPTPRWQGL